MKKGLQFLSFSLVMSLLFLCLQGFAPSTGSISFHCAKFLNEYQEVNMWQRTPYYFTVENGVTLTATSSDDSVIRAEMVEDPETKGYIMYLTGFKGREVASITVTASDGYSVTSEVVVFGEQPYTISTDVTDDFTIAKGSAYILKVHCVYADTQTANSPSVVSDNENIIKATIMDYEPTADHDFFFRIEPVGDVGQSATLSIGGTVIHLHERLCTVTIGENKDLRLDTTTTHNCDTGDTYRFIAYTSSDVAPTVSTDDRYATTKLEGTVPGGYLYSVKALYPGTADVFARLNGETASFIIDIRIPSIISDTPSIIQLEPGKSYTYKLSVKGILKPKFMADLPEVFSIQKVNQIGNDYYVTVSAKPNTQGGSYFIATFPTSSDRSTFPVYVGFISTPKTSSVIPKSDTTDNFCLKQGQSYTFRLTNVNTFVAGTPGVFTTQLVKKLGNDSFYKITAIGQPNQSAGFYMAASNQPSQKVCVVTVQASPSIKACISDTTMPFSVKSGATYRFKITAPDETVPSFSVGTGGVFLTKLFSHTGNDYYFEIKAIGKSGSSAGIYTILPGQQPQKQCVVSVAS
ncbi:hypothetical protein [Clostridium sp. KNHs216]|uniref:hypothetical protein n=1 Tax=Clostridium sp. KNHs216 TaxID=1550235 RepID=UPI00114F31CD|nr:hypothetical protein [Clostridium sp. KNHs216]TQI65402.1 hypothetical protein LY85_0034 [Clostridium sp. KNHs216]